MNNNFISKNMPPKFQYDDQTSTYVISRRAFFNNTFISHLPSNLSNNNSSLKNPKPIENKSSDLRTQRLRMNAIGSGKSKLKNMNDTISYKVVDQNYVNSSLTRVRGYGASSVPKKNSLRK